MTAGAHGLVQTISDAIKAEDAEVVITGENSAENMIDLVDGILEVTLDADTRAPSLLPSIRTISTDMALRYR